MLFWDYIFKECGFAPDGIKPSSKWHWFLDSHSQFVDFVPILQLITYWLIIRPQVSGHNCDYLKLYDGPEAHKSLLKTFAGSSIAHDSHRWIGKVVGLQATTHHQGGSSVTFLLDFHWELSSLLLIKMNIEVLLILCVCHYYATLSISLQRDGPIKLLPRPRLRYVRLTCYA